MPALVVHFISVFTVGTLYQLQFQFFYPNLKTGLRSDCLTLPELQRGLNLADCLKDENCIFFTLQPTVLKKAKPNNIYR